jgi:acetolactate synthase-1/2/3 large subunit
MTQMTGAEAIVNSLVRHGVDTIFGLPGGQLYYLYDALYQQGARLRTITTRHEQGAAYMALGYAHSTGRVGVYDVVPGPGVLNTTAALCTAWACNAPVLCLTGQIPTVGIGSGAGYLHELPDQLGVMRALTKWATRIEQPADAPAMVAKAFRQLTTGRPRPVELEMAPDIMELKAEVQLLDAIEHPPVQPDPERVTQAARLLAKAERPLIMVGGGARDAGDALLTVAELLQAPVVSHRQGKGIISDRHYLGQTYPVGHHLWGDADVVLAVGTRLKYPLMYWGTRGLKVVRVDIDPDEVARVKKPEVALVADARASLTALANELPRHMASRPSRAAELQELKTAFASRYDTIQPQLSYLKVMREELPDDGYFVDEITQTGFASWYGFPCYEPRHFISSGYQGTLGYGYATALGVKVAHPDKLVLQISGDGGFMYNVQELATAVAERIHLVTVIFSDDRFGNVERDLRTRFGEGTIGAELRNPDFVSLAESFGAVGLRARSPDELRAALRQAFDEAGPVLIEVPVGEMSNPWEFIMLPAARD